MQNILSPSNLEIIFSNAVNHQINKQMGLAEEGYIKCIESEYKLFDCLNNLGLLYIDIQDFSKAEYVFLQMVNMQSDHKDAYLNLESIYTSLGQTDKAIELYETALLAHPELVEIYNNLGVLYKAQNRYDEALSTYLRGLLSAPRHELLQYNLSNLINGRTLAPEFMKLERIQAVLSECLSFPENEYQNYLITILGYLFDKYALDDFNFDNENGYLLLQNPLFQKTLRKTIITNFHLEHFLIKVRKEILQGLVNKMYKKKDLERLKGLVSSLAIQCFWTEYVYYVDDEEKMLLKRLDAMTREVIKRKEKEAFFYIALMGCYAPLHSKRFVDNKFISQERDKNSALKELFRVQVEEPLKEKNLKETIETLKPIDDDVSKKVARQYEENPYPRWSSVRRVHPQLLEDMIKVQLPLLEEMDCHYTNEDKIDILIAGSGTGKHPIEVSQQILHADVVGVDLSSASLAYAKRKATELGIDNLKLLQGNILDLKQMDKQFDVVESVGVLHHMDEPLKGWKVLTDMLKPKGYMKIGLYSESARRSVVDTLSFIKDKGYKANIDDIRQCRNDIYRLGKGHSMWQLINYIDFYSVSGTRDLVFNVQEHRFTIPAIASAIKTLGLSFLGFSFRNKDVFQKYLEMFPEDSNGQDLKNWHLFEQRYPDTFIEMYQFWLQKQA